jgi:hypothetical protein
MKLLLFADLHMCPRASIVNKWGNTYSLRLENCLKSINWVERTAEELGCSYIINLGDFFDKPDLTSDTITAIRDIEWSDIPHIHLVGNHDASVSSLAFNSTNSLMGNIHQIVTEPVVKSFDTFDLCMLPYVVESDRKPLCDYFAKNTSKRRLIISHNDLNGIQLGPVVSKTGFTIEEIQQNCDLFLNGHLHNGQHITSTIINLGNLTGKDFGEDASKHAHNIAVFDTETFEVSFIENPYAFNFYKLQLDTAKDIKLLSKLKQNAVLSIKCQKGLVDEVRAHLATINTIVEARIIVVNPVSDSETTAQELDLSSVDHLMRFVECCKANIDNTRILDEELAEVCK